MRSLKSFVVLMTLMLVVAACMQMFIPSVAHASTSYTWTGQGYDDQWTTPSNWNPSGIPGAGDSVTIGPSPTATVTLPPSTKVQNLTLDGNYNQLSGGSLTVTGNFTWMGDGSISMPLDIPSGATASIINAPGDNKTLQANLSVEGSASVSGPGLVIDQVSIINTGTFTFEPGAVVNVMACCQSLATFTNQGTVVVPSPSSGTGVATLAGLAFNDQGSVNIGKNSTLELQVAPSTFASGVSIAGAGTLLIDNSAIVQLNGSVKLGKGTTFELGVDQYNSAGTLTGTGTLSGSGSKFSWTGGIMVGTFTIASSVTTRISGTVQKMLQAPGGNGTTTLNLAGPTTLASGSTLIFSGGGAIINNMGTFTPQAGSTITSGSCCYSPAQFNNKGTFSVSVGTGKTFSVSYVAFNNSGTVNVKSGIFKFDNPGYTQTGGVTKLSGGTLVSASPGQASITLNGGKLTGKGTITSYLQNGALIDPGTSVPGEGQITIVGNYTQTSTGTLRIDIKGTGSPGTNYDQLVVNGTATLSGTLDIETASGFTPPLGAQFVVVQATTLTGTFATLLHYQLPNNTEYVASYTTTTATLQVKAG